MKIESIRPKIRFADQLEYTASRTLSKTYDSRMLYITSGSGRIELDGKESQIEAGLLIIFKSGVAYKFFPTPTFKAYAIDFDLDGEHDVSSGFLPPVPIHLFDESKMHKTEDFENSTFLSEPFAQCVRPEIGEEIRSLVGEYTSGRRFCRERAELMLTGLLLDIERRSVVSSKGELCALAVTDYISEHYLEPLTNASVARAFGYDPCYLGRVVKLYTGSTIHRILIQKRIEVGIKLLLATDLPLDVIAERTGFCSAAHFSKRCRAITGNTPSYYRKS